METVVTALEEEEEAEEQWDCETIISTYSNLYNHPKELDQPRIKLSDKTGGNCCCYKRCCSCAGGGGGTGGGCTCSSCSF